MRSSQSPPTAISEINSSILAGPSNNEPWAMYLRVPENMFKAVALDNTPSDPSCDEMKGQEQPAKRPHKLLPLGRLTSRLLLDRKYITSQLKTVDVQP
jgi:hypothetical protein